jgi:hypothetical protein
VLRTNTAMLQFARRVGFGLKTATATLAWSSPKGCCWRLERHHRPDRLAGVHQVEGLVDLLERHHVGDQVVDVDFFSMYQSTIFGTSLRPLAPPNAVPFQTRPVTSWNGRS